MEQPVQKRGRHDGISEDLTPFCEAAVRCQDHRALFGARVDELEEQVGSATGDRQIPDFVDDQQRSPCVEADLLRQTSLSFSLRQTIDELGQSATIDASACLHGSDAEGGCEMALTCAGRAEEVQNLSAVDEFQLGQRHDAMPVKRWLEREVEAFKGLDRGEPRRAQPDTDPASLAQCQFLGQQGVDRLDRADAQALPLQFQDHHYLPQSNHLHALPLALQGLFCAAGGQGACPLTTGLSAQLGNFHPAVLGRLRPALTSVFRSDATEPCLLDHGDQRLFRGFAGFEKAGKQLPCRSFRTFRFNLPSRVCRARLR